MWFICYRSFTVSMSLTDTRNAADGRHSGGNHGRGGSYRHGRGKLFKAFDSVLMLYNIVFFVSLE